MESSPVDSQLESARRDLLDLGMRNPLLNYQLLRAKGVDIVDELPADVLQILVGQGKQMSFLPVSEPADADNLAQPDDEQADSWEPAARHVDNRLQTSHDSGKLQTRLLNTHNAAKTFVEEQGVNVLYLALGMLHWYEADASNKARLSPLILVPAQLERSSALDRFHLRYTGEEVSGNPSLVEKLRSDFGLNLPEYSEDQDLLTYFDAVTGVVARHPRWSVDASAVVLGFFSFGKYLMYRDLASEGWPETSKPADHPILQALLSFEHGFEETPLDLDEDANLDRLEPAETLKHVVDADSSQARAIVLAGRGHHLIIQGPPGTGKSQTITNLIAGALNDGKTVLFVSEKMAALEVVQRRLASIGLGPACLELHSSKTLKRALIDELRRTLAQARPPHAESDTDTSMLLQSRARLNEYDDAMHSAIGKTAITPFRALGETLRIRERLRDVMLVPPRIDGLADLSEHRVNQARDLVQQLQLVLVSIGDPAASPFWGTARTALSPIEQQQLVDELDGATAVVADVAAENQQLPKLLNEPEEDTRQGAQGLLQVAARVITTPMPLSIDLARPEWVTEVAALRVLVQHGERLVALHGEFDGVVTAEAWNTPVTDLRDQLATLGPKWWRSVSKTYRTARTLFRGLCSIASPGLSDQLRILDAILEEQQLRKSIDEQALLGAALFGSLWRDVQSDWQALHVRAAWAEAVHKDVDSGALPASFIHLAVSDSDLGEIYHHRQKFELACGRYDVAICQALASMGFDSHVMCDGRPFMEATFTKQKALLVQWRDGVGSFARIVRLNGLRAQCRDAGLEPIVSLALGQRGVAPLLTDLFQLAWLEALLARAFRERLVLSTLEREAHETCVQRFCEADVRVLGRTRSRLALQHWEHLPRQQAYGQLAILRREFEKRSRLLPIRQLMLKAGNVVQAMKPVFMMSPLSIANFLPPNSVTFDLIVFDEASQVKPIDAFGALLRGRQAIVVGDDRQLPPTSFFDSVATDTDDEDERVTDDIESILGLFRAQGAAQCMLRWHYRSRHESLIAVSNQQFYENRLVTFPSPVSDRADAGLHFHYLPTTSYDRSHSRANRGEAEVVAQAVMRHARATPQLTLGVAGFSMAQRQAIEEVLEQLRRQDTSTEAFFADHPSEPFFIKNLENVQGDERDVIFISIGYGKSADGKLTMQFGPLNQQGGERRLNVLISRARLRCEVFSNIRAADLHTDAKTPFGVQSLKVFLDYAENGVLTAPRSTDRSPDSEFEIAVRDRLLARGYQVDAQVGTAGYFIDLAVIDPDVPGRYLLGIECDGATYHSAKSARDRDRLRQDVLEKLGWRIHRIWSTDWFRDPDREIDRVASAIEAARHDRQNKSSASEIPPDTERAAEPDGNPEVRGPSEPAENVEFKPATMVVSANTLPRYETAVLPILHLPEELHLMLPYELLPHVLWVVKIEGPVHVDEVSRRIMDAVGIKRRGARIQDAFARIFALADQKEAVRKVGNFLWPIDMTVPVLRDRSQAPAATRQLDMICTEEIALAIRRALADSYGMAPEEVSGAVCRLFGFLRVSDDMRTRVDEVVGNLQTTGEIDLQGTHLVVKNTRGVGS